MKHSGTIILSSKILWQTVTQVMSTQLYEFWTRLLDWYRSNINGFESLEAQTLFSDQSPLSIWQVSSHDNKDISKAVKYGTFSIDPNLPNSNASCTVTCSLTISWWLSIISSNLSQRAWSWERLSTPPPATDRSNLFLASDFSNNGWT